MTIASFKAQHRQLYTCCSLTPLLVHRVKEEARKNRLENEARIFQEKLAVVEETKMERLQIERMVTEQRLLDRRTALEKKEEVKQAALEGGSARLCYMKRKAQMAIDNYTAKIEVEIEARREKEKEVQRMADLELELIDRLKERQHEQQLVRRPHEPP